MEAAGYDVVIVETVGVGQSEVAVAGMVDTFLMLTLARAGDQLQGIKRGILEMVDVIAVNKADGDGEGEARVAARELTMAMRLITSDPDARRPPVLAVLDHRTWLETSGGGLEERRATQQISWLWALVEGELGDALRRAPSVRTLRAGLEADVAAGDLSALEASGQILRALAHDLPGMLT